MLAGVGFVLLTCLIWAVVPLFIHVALQEVDPLTIAIFRLVTAGVVFGILGRSLWHRVFSGDSRRWVFLAAVVLGINYVAFNGGILLTSVSVTVLIMQTQAIFAALFSAWLLGERFGRSKLLGAAVAIGGSMLVAWGQQNGEVPQGDALVGVFVILLAATAWGCFIVAQKRLQQAVGRSQEESEHLHAFAVLGPVFAGGAVVTLAASPLYPTYGYAWAPGTLAVLVGALGLLGTTLAYYFLVRGLERIPASTVSILLNLIPVLTVTLAYLLLDEPVTLLMIVGGVFTIAGSTMVVMADHRQSPAAGLEAAGSSRGRKRPVPAGERKAGQAHRPAPDSAEDGMEGDS